MKERWVKVTPEADSKQEDRFNTWLSGQGIPFSDPEAEEAFRERVTLIKDAIQLQRSPSRIPVCPSAGFYPIQYAGFTMYEAMYDYDILAQAWQKFCKDFPADAYSGPTMIVPGRVLDLMDFLLYQWPGHGVAKQHEYQYVEKEYMKAEEYQELIDDPTGFFMTVYFPRISGSLKAFERIPLLPIVNEIPCVPPALIPFGTEEIQTALNKLMEAGQETLKWRTAVGKINQSIMGLGYPSFTGGFTKAPFDVIGDTLRGTRGVLMDIYRHPDELIEACERLIPFMIKAGVNSCNASGHLMPLIPLHKGADGFMSDDQFKTFYWPTLRKLIIGLVNEGIVPILFAEGSYNQRLEVISDLPKGKVIWWFDLTDMKKAKETVGQVACIAGNVPVSLLCNGTTDEVKAYCEDLINIAGKGGGFIFSTGAGMQGARAKNIRAMMDTAKERGVYED